MSLLHQSWPFGENNTATVLSVCMCLCVYEVAHVHVCACICVFSFTLIVCYSLCKSSFQYVKDTCNKRKVAL